MRNVQDCLREADIDKLISCYIEQYPVYLKQICLDHIYDDVRTVKELVEQFRAELRQYIERLCSMDVQVSLDGKDYILFAHKHLGNWYEEPLYSLVCIQELMEKGVAANTYSCITDKQAMIMGYYVSEAGYKSKTISFNGLLEWDVSNVTDMSYMFYKTGVYYGAIKNPLNLSSWNDKVGNVTNYNNFNTNITNEVIAPTWVN